MLSDARFELIRERQALMAHQAKVAVMRHALARIAAAHKGVSSSTLRAIADEAVEMADGNIPYPEDAKGMARYGLPMPGGGEVEPTCPD